MPWCQRDDYRFWVAEHKDNGVVIFHNPGSFEPLRPMVVVLYVVRMESWVEFDRNTVKEALVTGRQFDIRNPEWCEQFSDWHWVLMGARIRTSEFQNPSPIFVAPSLPIPEIRESLIGWGSAGPSSDSSENDSVDMRTEDWTKSFDDCDSASWENYMGGPDE